MSHLPYPKPGTIGIPGGWEGAYRLFSNLQGQVKLVPPASSRCQCPRTLRGVTRSVTLYFVAKFSGVLNERSINSLYFWTYS